MSSIVEEAVAEEGDPVWAQTRDRLAQRDHPKWESLSWLALRPLIDSLNDRVNALCPRLVPDLRQAWLRQPGFEYGDGVVDRGTSRAFLLMGDTGELDASQYAVGTALAALPAGEPEPAFALICSDVIYPSGDVNDYVHGFYLPYERLLHEPGAEAAPQRIYGLPGNHDWYDGLTGFMHTFCARPALDQTNYGWPARPSLREGIGRLLWRRPSAPMPAKLHRDDAAPVPLERIRAERMRAPSPGTGQPGPYFAIQLDGLLAVCIDAGIGSGGNSWIDAEQGRWLLRVSARPGPKVLLTGYPLLVNAEWKQCLIKDFDGRAGDGPPSVNAVVTDPRHRYVAAIGGDIHNFEHYDTRIGDDAHPMTYLVAGGGGAYTSATHPIASAARLQEQRGAGRADPERIRAANERRGGPPTEDDVAHHRDAAARAPRGQRHLGPLPNLGDEAVRGRHGIQLPMIPTAAASMVHFTEQVLPRTWRMVRVLLCFLAGLLGLLVGLLVVPAAGSRAGLLLVLGVGVLGAGVVARALVPQMAPPRRGGDRRRLRIYRAELAVAAGLAGAVTGLAARWTSPAHAGRYLGCWAVLLAVAAGLGLLQRRSGWWREPSPEPGGDHAASSLAGFALVLAAGGLALSRLTGGAGAVPRAAGLLVIVAAAGWFGRRAPGWRRSSPVVAPLVQLGVAGYVLSAVPAPGARARPLAVVLGLLLNAALVAVAVAVAVVLAVALARVRAARHPELGGWRRALGSSAHVVPAVAVILAAELVLLWQTAGPQPFWRTAVVTAWAPALLVIPVLGVDSLRRRYPGRYRYLATPLVAGMVAAVGYGAWRGSWLAGGLVVATIVGLLGIVAVATGYLAFLGGHRLLLDLPAHADRVDRPGRRALLTHDEAEAVIRWRRTGRGTDAVPQPALDRARFVFPSTEQPQGLIQRKVSEFFSSDAPPFFQHVLRLARVGPNLEITPLLVTGLSPATVARPTIVVALDGSPATVRP